MSVKLNINNVLADDMFPSVFSFLTPLELTVASGVCRSWQEVASSQWVLKDQLSRESIYTSNQKIISKAFKSVVSKEESARLFGMFKKIESAQQQMIIIYDLMRSPHTSNEMVIQWVQAMDKEHQVVFYHLVNEHYLSESESSVNFKQRPKGPAAKAGASAAVCVLPHTDKTAMAFDRFRSKVQKPPL